MKLDVVSVVGPTGVKLLDFFYSCIQLYVQLCLYFCFISFLYFDLYVQIDQTSFCLDPHQIYG